MRLWLKLLTGPYFEANVALDYVAVSRSVALLAKFAGAVTKLRRCITLLMLTFLISPHQLSESWVVGYEASPLADVRLTRELPVVQDCLINA